MNESQIMNAVSKLAMSKGSYGRLKERLSWDKELMDTMVSQNFGDVVDMVMWLEG